MTKRYENVWELWYEITGGSMYKIVKWVSMVTAVAMAGAALYHGQPEFGWIATVFIAVAGGEEVAELIQQSRR